MYPFANAVNDADHVVGTINCSVFTYVYGFGWTNPTDGMVILPWSVVELVLSATETNGINNRNRMVGAVAAASTWIRATLCTGIIR